VRAAASIRLKRGLAVLAQRLKRLADDLFVGHRKADVTPPLLLLFAIASGCSVFFNCAMRGRMPPRRSAKKRRHNSTSQSAGTDASASACQAGKRAVEAGIIPDTRPIERRRDGVALDRSTARIQFRTARAVVGQSLGAFQAERRHSAHSCRPLPPHHAARRRIRFPRISPMNGLLRGLDPLCDHGVAQQQRQQFARRFLDRRRSATGTSSTHDAGPAVGAQATQFQQDQRSVAAWIHSGLVKSAACGNPRRARPRLARPRRRRSASRRRCASPRHARATSNAVAGRMSIERRRRAERRRRQRPERKFSMVEPPVFFAF
jgi:hypothetical protein